MFKNTKEIIETLEEAIKLFDSNSALTRDKAKWMIVGSRHALQALTLDFVKERHSNKVIDIKCYDKLPNKRKI